MKRKASKVIWGISEGTVGVPSLLTQFQFSGRYSTISLPEILQTYDDVSWEDPRVLDALEDLVSRTAWEVPTHVVFKKLDEGYGKDQTPLPTTFIEFFNRYKITESIDHVTTPYHELCCVAAFHQQSKPDAVVTSFGASIDASYAGFATYKDNKVQESVNARWAVSTSAIMSDIGHSLKRSILPDVETMENHHHSRYENLVTDLAAGYQVNLEEDKELHNKMYQNFGRVLCAIPDYIAWTKNNFLAQGNPFPDTTNVEPERKVMYDDSESYDGELMRANAILGASRRHYWNNISFQWVREQLEDHGKHLIVCGKVAKNPKLFTTVNRLRPFTCELSADPEAVTLGMAINKALELDWEKVQVFRAYQRWFFMKEQPEVTENYFGGVWEQKYLKGDMRKGNCVAWVTPKLSLVVGRVEDREDIYEHAKLEPYEQLTILISERHRAKFSRHTTMRYPQMTNHYVVPNQGVDVPDDLKCDTSYVKVQTTNDPALAKMCEEFGYLVCAPYLDDQHRPFLRNHDAEKVRVDREIQVYITEIGKIRQYQ